MRPIHLTMSAFGPFAQTEEIDFTSLGENPLFLINGPTGAGKTTILDGICYALYGSTTGAEREASHMRCDQAPADLLIEVTLIFSLHDKQYRIKRLPAQSRPKAKGDGFTNQTASAELAVIAADGSEQLLVPRKVTEANEHIINLTGLTAEQFRQVMVLPQGEFRKLLTADSKDREKIFGRLFQTQIYNKIEQLLAEQAKEITKQTEAIKNQRKGILLGAELSSEDELQEQQTAINAQCRVQQEAQQKAEAHRDKRNQQSIKAQAVVKQFDALAQHKNQLEQLLNQEQSIKQLQAELAEAKQAQRIAPEFNNQKQAAARLEKAQASKAEKKHALEQAVKALAEQDSALEQAKQTQPKINEARNQQLHLESLLPRLAQLSSAKSTVVQTSNRIHLQKKEVKNAGNSLARTEAEEATQQASLQQLLNEQQDESLALNELQQCAQQLDLAAKREKLVTEIAKSNKQLLNLNGVIAVKQNELTDALTQFKQLELQWHQAQATILALQLNEGEACLVCGSTSHPNPASTEHTVPSEEQREQANLNVDSARSELHELENSHSVISNQLAQQQRDLVALDQQLGELATNTLATFQENKAQAKAKVDKALQQKQEIELLRDQLQTNAKILKQQREQKEKVQAKFARLESEHQLALRDVEQAENELPENYRQVDALKAALSEAQAHLQKLEAALEQAKSNHAKAERQKSAAQAELDSAKSNALSLQQEQQQAIKAWQQALTASPFEDAAAFKQAARSEDLMAELEQKIQHYHSALATEKGAIQSLSTALQSVDKPDLGQLENALAEAQAAVNEQSAKTKSLEQRQKTLLDVADQLQKAKAKSAEIEKQFEVVGTLSEAANGKRGNRVSLHRFVLSALLDDVLVAASHRLKRMSKGRYQLFRKLEANSGQGGAGLDLMVEDAYNGKQRGVATLSGGESFMAALSMALGLSDVVQAHSGGLRLDTLFVDEGFGSLDPESLDLAVNTLIDLQAAGRMVGVISHVPELKERIATRLDVIAERDGSHTKIVA